MTRFHLGRMGTALLGGVLMLPAAAVAQQKSQNAPRRNLYDLNREISVQGSVISYSEKSSSSPFGPRVMLQTGSGVLDVHLGDARLLQNNHFTLAAGDAVRIIGESVPFGSGTQFVARMIQKGGQTVLLRSAEGFPLRPTSSTKGANGSAGVL